ncbi:KxYKxGKxW signal peptide domain-containing protein, partial [Secundilactobacillus hailunensis]
MEKYKFNRQKLECDTAERKVRFKLYKAGTRWLVAGMATLTFGLGAFSAPEQVKADTNSSTGESDTSSSTTKNVTGPNQVALKSSQNNAATSSTTTQSISVKAPSTEGTKPAGDTTNDDQQAITAPQSTASSVTQPRTASGNATANQTTAAKPSSTEGTGSAGTAASDQATTNKTTVDTGATLKDSGVSALTDTKSQATLAKTVLATGTTANNQKGASKIDVDAASTSTGSAINTLTDTQTGQTALATAGVNNQKVAFKEAVDAVATTQTAVAAAPVDPTKTAHYIVSYIDEDEDNRVIQNVLVTDTETLAAHGFYNYKLGYVQKSDGTADTTGPKGVTFNIADYNYDLNKLSEKAGSTFEEGLIDDPGSKVPSYDPTPGYEIIKAASSRAQEYIIQLQHKYKTGVATGSRTVNFKYTDGATAAKSVSDTAPFEYRTDLALQGAKQASYTKKDGTVLHQTTYRFNPSTLTPFQLNTNVSVDPKYKAVSAVAVKGATPNVASIPAVSVTNADGSPAKLSYDIIYTPKHETPENNTDQLDLTKNVTENVIYKSSDGTQLDTDNNVQTLTFYRTATVKEDGSGNWGYSVWTTNPDGVSEHNDDKSDDTKGTINKVPDYILNSQEGYTFSKATTAVDGKAVTAANDPVTVTGANNTVTRTLIYTKNPDMTQTDGPTQTVTRTIHFVDQATGTQVHPDIKQTVTFGTKYIKATNTIVSYTVKSSDEDGDGKADTTTNKIFTSLKAPAPTVAAYTGEVPDIKVVSDQNVPVQADGLLAGIQTTVTYSKPAEGSTSIHALTDDSTAGKHIVYFYTGSVVSKTSDIPKGSVIGQATINDGAKGATGAVGATGAAGVTPNITVNPTGTTSTDGSTTTYQVLNGTKSIGSFTVKNGSTPTLTENPTKTGYDVQINGKTVGTLTNGAQGIPGAKGDTGATGAAGKDGATPVVTTTPKKDTSGNVIGTTVTLTTAGQAPVSFNVVNGTNGAAAKPVTIDTAPTTGQNGQTGTAVTVNSYGPDGKLQQNTFYVYNGQKGDKGDTGTTGATGKDGVTPVVTTTPETDASGSVIGTTVTFTTTGQAPVSFNVANGATPTLTETKDNQGNVTGYDVLINGQKVGTLTNGAKGDPGAAGKDGSTPTIDPKQTTTDKDGNTTYVLVDGAGKTVGTFTANKGAKGDTGAQGIQGVAGKDGSTPTIDPSKTTTGTDANGNPTTTYHFMITGPDGKPADVGQLTVTDGKNGTNGDTPKIDPSKTTTDANGNQVYTLVDSKGNSLGTLTAPKG